MCALGRGGWMDSLSRGVWMNVLSRVVGWIR